METPRKSKKARDRQKRLTDLRTVTARLVEEIGIDQYAEKVVQVTETNKLRGWKVTGRGDGKNRSIPPVVKSSVLRFLGGGGAVHWVEEAFRQTNAYLLAVGTMRGPIRAPEPKPGEIGARTKEQHEALSQEELPLTNERTIHAEPESDPFVDPDLLASAAVRDREGERNRLIRAMQGGATVRDDAPVWARLLNAALHGDNGEIAEIVIELQERGI